MDNKILYTAKFTHHDLKFHKVWWKSDKRCGSWSGQTDRQTNRQARQTGRFLYTPQTMFAGGIIIKRYIGSLPNLTSLFPCGRGRTLYILGLLGQRSRAPGQNKILSVCLSGLTSKFVVRFPPSFVEFKIMMCEFCSIKDFIVH